MLVASSSKLLTWISAPLKSVQMPLHKSSKAINRKCEWAGVFLVHNCFVFFFHRCMFPYGKRYVWTEPKCNVMCKSYILHDTSCCKSGIFKMYYNTEVCEFRISYVHNIMLFSFRNLIVSINPSSMCISETL